MATSHWKKLTSAIIVGILISSLAWGGAGLRPAWVGKPASALKPNNSFLSDVQSNVEEAQVEALHKRLFDGRKAAELRQDYEVLARDCEMHKVYGLADPQSEKDYYDKFAQNRNEAFKHVRGRQVEQGRNSLNAGARRGEVNTAVVFSGTMASIYFGNPIHPQIDESTKIVAKTDFIAERAEVKVSSSIVDGAFNIASDRAYEEAKKNEPDKEHERYRMSLSRGLGVLDLGGGLSYGGSSDKFTASLSRPLSQHLTCVVENSVKVSDPAASSEKKVSFQYKVTF